MKIVPLIVALLIFFLPPASGSWKTEGRKIEDEYLRGLFTPDFPYNFVKVMEDGEGKKYILIEGKENLTDPIFNKFAVSLLNRGVNLIVHYTFGAGHTWLSEYGITITRRVEGDPGAIEFSSSEIKDHRGNPIKSFYAVIDR